MREDAAVGLELPVAVALDTEKYDAAESFLELLGIVGLC
jgi:hypothetical protein